MCNYKNKNSTRRAKNFIILPRCQVFFARRETAERCSSRHIQALSAKRRNPGKERVIIFENRRVINVPESRFLVLVRYFPLSALLFF